MNKKAMQGAVVIMGGLAQYIGLLAMETGRIGQLLPPVLTVFGTVLLSQGMWLVMHQHHVIDRGEPNGDVSAAGVSRKR